MDFQAFEDILALLIYGLVLFPNSDQFIDINAIKVFLSRNPVPTLLGDILHFLHTRTIKKRGTLLCCIPLLAKWFTSHLPQSALKNKQILTWSQRMISLTHFEDVSIIDRCGEFPNVPLLGIRGGITYNPCSAFRQFGYARRDGPHEMLIQGLVFDYDKEDQGYRQRFTCAWGMVNKVDSRTLGNKNSIPLEPYLKWVWARAQSLLMPYPSILSVIIEHVIEGDIPYTVLHPDMPTSLEDLQKACKIAAR